MTLSGTPAVESDASQTSLIGRLVGTFLSPSEAFSEIVNTSDYWNPWLVSVIPSVATMHLVLTRFGIARLVTRPIRHTATHAATNVYLLSGLLVVVLGPLVQAAISLLILRSGFGQRTRFRTLLSIASYASVVQIVRAIAAMPVIMFGDLSGLNPRNLLPTNLAFFLTATSVSHSTMAIAKTVDIFVIWEAILLSIGASKATNDAVKPSAFFKAYFGFQLLLSLAFGR